MIADKEDGDLAADNAGIRQQQRHNQKERFLSVSVHTTGFSLMSPTWSIPENTKVDDSITGLAQLLPIDLVVFWEIR